MELDEAMAYHTKKAKSLREEAIQWTKNGIPSLCKECEGEAENHEQLVSWLTELRDIRKIVKDWQDGKIDDDMPMLKAFSRIIKIIEKSEAENEIR